MKNTKEIILEKEKQVLKLASKIYYCNLVEEKIGRKYLVEFNEQKFNYVGYVGEVVQSKQNKYTNFLDGKLDDICNDITDTYNIFFTKSLFFNLLENEESKKLVQLHEIIMNYLYDILTLRVEIENIKADSYYKECMEFKKNNCKIDSYYQSNFDFFKGDENANK